LGPFVFTLDKFSSVFSVPSVAERFLMEFL